MKFFVAFLALAAVAAADVAHLVKSPEESAQILRYDSDISPVQHEVVFETSNGIASQQSGELKNAGREDEAYVIRGSNAYTAPDGSNIALTYVADENGYQPQGAHLPTPPAPQPIPDYILRSLEFIAAHPPKPESLSRA